MMQSVQILIERLKTHPEDFFGGIDEMKGLGLMRPKFYDITDKIDNLLTHPQDGHVHRLWYLTDAERIALLDAYKEARRARFEANVFHTLLTKPEEDMGVALQTRTHLGTGKTLMSGWSDARGLLGAAVPKAEGGPV